jgi:hypothetical protein
MAETHHVKRSDYYKKEEGRTFKTQKIAMHAAIADLTLI